LKKRAGTSGGYSMTEEDAGVSLRLQADGGRRVRLTSAEHPEGAVDSWAV